MRQLQHLVLDEADRILSLDFEEDIDKILKARGVLCGCCIVLAHRADAALTLCVHAGHPHGAADAAVQRDHDVQGACEMAAVCSSYRSQHTSSTL